jgi:tetratricopeptide (TPR) repeat protein
LYLREGDFNKSLEAYYRLLYLDSLNSYYYKQAALAASRLENKTLAAQLYSKALKLNQKDNEATLAYGNILMDLEQFHMVDSVIENALAFDPQSRNLLILRTKSAFEQHHNEIVISTLNDLLTKTDTTVTFARLLGISFFNMKEYEKSRTCMLFLLRNRFEGESIYYYLGVASRELGNVSESIEYLKHAVELSISDNIVSYYIQLGQSYEKTGNSKAAISAYRSGYSYSKKGILLYHLARNYDVYYSDKTKAAEYYKKYLASEDTTRVIKDYARRRMQDMGYY